MAMPPVLVECAVGVEEIGRAAFGQPAQKLVDLHPRDIADGICKGVRLMGAPLWIGREEAPMPLVNADRGRNPNMLRGAAGRDGPCELFGVDLLPGEDASACIAGQGMHLESLWCVGCGGHGVSSFHGLEFSAGF